MRLYERQNGLLSKNNIQNFLENLNGYKAMDKEKKLYRVDFFEDNIQAKVTKFPICL